MTVAASGPRAATSSPGLVPLLLVSFAATVVQVTWTDYGPDSAGASSGVVLLHAFLLWRVHRRGRIARGFLVVTSAVGTVVYALVALTGGRPTLLALGLAVAFAAQGLPLLAPPVRRHVSGETGRG